MRTRTAVGLAGAVVTVVGAVVVAVPSVTRLLLPDPVVGLLSSVGAGPVLLAGGAVVTASLVASALVPSGERVVDGDGTARERFERTLDGPPEGVVDTTSRTASGIDATVARAVAGDETAFDDVRDRLTTLVVATLAADTDDRRTAREAVATGRWTDDPVAAAFLGGPDGPDQPAVARVRHWLAPERERERRIDRTVAALEALDPDDSPPGGVA